jgi:hypothetical protein
MGGVRNAALISLSYALFCMIVSGFICDDLHVLTVIDSH